MNWNRFYLKALLQLVSHVYMHSFRLCVRFKPGLAQFSPDSAQLDSYEVVSKASHSVTDK